MGYRGRLIRAQVAELAQIDTLATAVGPPPGYDPEFREPVRVPDTSPRGSHSARREKLTRLPCQIMVSEDGRLEEMSTGATLRARLQLTFHMADLETRGMVDVNGQPMINVGDRLKAIYHQSGALIEAFPDPPGLYAVRVQPQSYGLDGLNRNLLVVDFADREQGSRV